MAQATHQDDTTETRITADEPSLLSMLLKDGAVVLAALSIWAGADTWFEVTGLWLAQAVAVGDAVFVGLLLASLFHEWGHYTGAVATNASVARFYPKRLTFFRFNFLYAENDVRQFHAMTIGGHAFHWGVLILLLITLPLDNLGRITLVSAVFGFIIFASVIEYNIVKDTMAGADPETRLQALTQKDIQQAGIIGTMAGLFAVAALS